MNKKSAQQKGLAPIIIIAVVGVIIAGVVVLSKGNSATKQPGQNTTSPTKQTEQQSSTDYSNYDNNVSFQTPEGWTIKENSPAANLAAFFSPKEGEDDKFIENVGVDVSDLSAKPNVTLDEIVKAWVDQSKTEFPDSFKVVSEEKITLGGVDGVKIISQARDKISPLKGLAIFALEDNKAYIITYTAEEKSFDKFLGGANQIINSFKFGEVTLDWETFKNSEMGYSVKHPKGWAAKDGSGENNRKLTVSHPKNFANVLIAAHKDDTLKENGGMAKAIKGRKEFLESDKELKITDFKDTVEEKKGGWMMIGEKTIDGQKWQLEERGLLDIYGKVLLMQSGYSESYGTQYKDAVRQIMDSFSVE